MCRKTQDLCGLSNYLPSQDLGKRVGQSIASDSLESMHRLVLIFPYLKRFPFFRMVTSPGISTSKTFLKKKFFTACERLCLFKRGNTCLKRCISLINQKRSIDYFSIYTTARIYYLRANRIK